MPWQSKERRRAPARFQVLKGQIRKQTVRAKQAGNFPLFNCQSLTDHRCGLRAAEAEASGFCSSHIMSHSFSYPEPILRAVNGARQGALAKSISNWHLIGHNEGCCSNTGYILLPCFYGIRLWIWPEPLVAPRVRRALGTRMCHTVNKVLCDVI